ncbi:MAG: alpha amylase C-terminal domain-containing protein, partial [Chloroflexi bacterium]|nr:alpha amylase C-terminal domain-containing protein [Chloroflexota bacterium]
VDAVLENLVLPLSQDEVVHGKGTLRGKMPGDDWQKYANLRLLFGYMYAQPGKKLLFMGGEFGQWGEWSHDGSLEWHLLQYQPHSGLQRWVSDLNRFYQSEPALHQVDFAPAGFEWIDCNDVENGVVSLIRKGKSPDNTVIIVCNFTPMTLTGYRIGVPEPGFWKEILNSDAHEYGGSGQGNAGGVASSPVPQHGRSHSLSIIVPPLAVVFFRLS